MYLIHLSSMRSVSDRRMNGDIPTPGGGSPDRDFLGTNSTSPRAGPQLLERRRVNLPKNPGHNPLQPHLLGRHLEFSEPPTKSRSPSSRPQPTSRNIIPAPIRASPRGPSRLRLARRGIAPSRPTVRAHPHWLAAAAAGGGGGGRGLRVGRAGRGEHAFWSPAPWSLAGTERSSAAGARGSR